MLLNFRQGLYSVQTSPQFLSLSDTGVNLNADSEPTIINFAYNDSNYLVIEKSSIMNAWSGPFSSEFNYYLYVNIDVRTGARTFGSTVGNFTYGNDFPLTPSINDHFYSYVSNTMNYWSGSRWVQVLRVFVGKLLNGSLLSLYNTGTQVGIYKNIQVGQMVYDDSGSPIKKNSGEFVTTETMLNTQKDDNNSFKIEAVQIDGKAIEPIPQFSCITWKGIKRIGIATNSDYKNPCIGVAIEQMGKDQVKKFVSSGYITNPTWNFTLPPNSGVWVGTDGSISTDVPKTISMQRIGHIVSPTTIFVDIREIILL